mmetsp:Transcript_3589/g.14484  ORF Transcript_3589/g.14484 Transcript_3589/m.14484 type:complete len:200 (+) Transcript_3589:914-1513(+)
MPALSPMATVCRHAMVSRIIFSASSILYLRATRKRRAVALRLPHGHMSAGISSPSGPKRPTSASTMSRQSSGWGYSWNTAPFEGAAAAGSFSSEPNQVPNIAASRGGGYGASRSTTPSARRVSVALRKSLRRTRRIMFERRAALPVDTPIRASGTLRVVRSRRGTRWGHGAALSRDGSRRYDADRNDRRRSTGFGKAAA